MFKLWCLKRRRPLSARLAVSAHVSQLTASFLPLSKTRCVQKWMNLRYVFSKVQLHKERVWKLAMDVASRKKGARSVPHHGRRLLCFSLWTLGTPLQIKKRCSSSWKAWPDEGGWKWSMGLKMMDGSSPNKKQQPCSRLGPTPLANGGQQERRD